MLTISKPLSAEQAENYHKQEFANARQEYYATGAAITGQWRGRLAERLELSGDVSTEHFHRLSHGQHPHENRVLVRTRQSHLHKNSKGEVAKTMGHRAGWDATFSAPKSVSIAALVGGDDRIRAAHRAAVDVSLRELERFTQARTGALSPAETTGAFVAATFEHDSARPVDGYSAPQLHTHCVIFNMTETANGRTRALQPRELFKSQQFGTAVYRAELAKRLRSLGYDIERGANGQPEIKGFTKEYLEAASPRRRQILEHLQHTGHSGAEAAHVAAQITRAPKARESSREFVQRQHQDMAAAFGDQPASVVEAARARGYRHVPERSAEDVVTYAINRNIEREAVIDERQLLADALKRGMGKITIEPIKTEVEHRVDTGALLLDAHRPVWMPARGFTTPEMKRLEQSTMDAMLAGKGQHRALVSDWTRAQIQREYAHFTPKQRAAVQQLLATRDHVTGLQGIAGGGKTTVLAAIRDATQREGYLVNGLAPTGRAAQKLADSGIETQTLQRHLAAIDRLDDETEIRPRLYVLDESSLASTVQMQTFLTHLRREDRVLLVGDTRQHQSVDAGKSFEQLQEAGLQTVHLDEIMRQTDPHLKRGVEHLSDGRVRNAFLELHHQGRVREIPDRSARLTHIAQAVAARPHDTLVVAPDNRSREELNDAIHKALQHSRTVHQYDQPTRILVPRQDMTGTDRGHADRYTVGDILRYSKGSAALRIDAGEYARVVDTDRDDKQLTVERLTTGRLLTYDPRRLRGVSVYTEAERHFATGDRIQFTAPLREHRVANRQLATITAISSTSLSVRLDSGRAVTFPIQEYPHVDFGYAVTSYSSQGSTADRVFVHIDTQRGSEHLLNQRLAYVAISRARHDVQVVTDNKEAMVNALVRDVSKRAAIEVRAPAYHQQRASGHGLAVS